jgi:hypothetical protein
MEDGGWRMEDRVQLPITIFQFPITNAAPTTPAVVERLGIGNWEFVIGASTHRFELRIQPVSAIHL